MMYEPPEPDLKDEGELNPSPQTEETFPGKETKIEKVAQPRDPRLPPPLLTVEYQQYRLGDAVSLGPSPLTGEGDAPYQLKPLVQGVSAEDRALAGIPLTRHLTVSLSPERREELRGELLEATMMEERLRGQLAEMTKTSKEAQRVQNKRRLDAAHTLEQAHEFQAIECRKVFRLGSNTVVVKRVDTGEVIEERAMTGADHSEMRMQKQK